ncbi:MAG: UbiA family prenyltransferase [Chitinophagales bacterium]
MELLKSIFKKTVDSLIFGSFFISFCAAALVLETYIQLGHKPLIDALVFFVFFSTLALYNFHRLMGIRRIRPEDLGVITGWAAKHQFTLLMLTIIGTGGAGFFVFQLLGNLPIILMLIPLALISLFYELPIVKVQKRFQRLRNLWLSKAFLITAVWVVTTAVLPALHIHYSVHSYNVLLIVTERMIFIFILALCFDARDIEFDLREKLRTIPMVFGNKVTRKLYYLSAALLCAVAVFHYNIILHFHAMGIAMAASVLLTLLLVSNTQPRKSDYYYLFLVDGMMIVQFVLALTAAYFP